jgi:glucosamine--fructose-6-phosphate aminotransferase (isomerizing)
MKAMPEISFMRREIEETAAVVRRQIDLNGAQISALVRHLRTNEPRLVTTIARGSSDHAALYLKYLVELALRLPCTSIGPSIASIYHRTLKLDGAMAVTISQSGRSPDIVALQQAASAGGALTVALVNDIASPVARDAQWCLPLQAGPERAVAATKSMIASLCAMALIVAAWGADAGLLAAVAQLPELLDRLDANEEVAGRLAAMRSCYVIGRGATLAIALEAALKLKETSAIHAEAFSAAEVLHGPAAIVERGFPIIAFMPQDEARPAMDATLARLSDMGAECIVFDADRSTRASVTIARTHSLIAPILMLHIFYGIAERTSRLRGRNPDQPRHLNKITETM